jgi:hypothetical protein
MTRAKAKAKAIWKPGKSSPAASRLGIQKPRRRSLTIGIAPETRNPLPGQPIRPTAEGLDHRFLRSQPRVIGPGSLRKARPRRSEYNLNTHPDVLNIRTNSGDTNRALPKHPSTR